ncbi:hypothetical protein ACFSC3_05945 [Sphingomonas floccifaciens]|uniref:Uncharacterized protein n=1 Tax=Sphingomonas floccifaciens TaxID=1844115 RepID=A0ABW4NAD1_9SPHN
MHTHKFCGGKVLLDEYAIDSIEKASLRLDQEGRSGRGLSTHEYNAAAIVNGHVDWIDGDFRAALVAMGADWAYGLVAVILDHWEREMTLPADHPNAPKGDQCVLKG